MATVYGPYPARRGYRMVVIEGKVRKSFIVESQTEAEKLRTEMTAALQQGGDRAIADVLPEYADYLRRVRGVVSAAHIVRALERFLTDQPSLSALTPERARALYDAETRRVLDSKGRPVAAASHRTLLGQCKRFCNWAVEQSYLPHNPFTGVRPIGKPRVGKAQLRIDEARRFVALTLSRAQTGDRAALAALMALLLGMRASEVLGRSVRDLDDDGRVLWITRGKTDNARRRLTVPEVLRPLLAGLAAGKAPTELLFAQPDAGRPLTDAWLWGHVQRLCDEAGVPRVSTHSLRGLHSTLALEAGATASAVAAALGHGSFEITAKHYAAPGTVERMRSKAVEQALSGPAPDADAAALAAADPAQLARALQRLPPQVLAALRKALAES